MSAARPNVPLCLILLTYVVSFDEVDAHMKAHAIWLEKGFAERLFLVAGRQKPRTGGVILTRGHKAEVEALAASDPFVASGVATVEVVEFNASFAAPEIAELLA